VGKQMAARKRATKKSTRPTPQVNVHGLDLTDISLKQIAGLIATVGVIIAAASYAFGWYFRAELVHQMAQEHDVVIGEYETIWNEARQQRKDEIAEAEAFYREHRGDR